MRSILGAAIGFLSVLHTWGQNLLHHPHVHCVIPVGGLSPDRTQWVHPRYPFFLPVKVLSRVFRGKFVAGLRRAFRRGRLSFPGRLHASDRRRRRSAPSCDDSFGTTGSSTPSHPSAAPRMCCSTSRATRTAWPSRIIGSSTSLTAASPFNGRTTGTGASQRTMTISADEFLRRFLLARPAQGFRPHSLLWVSRASSPRPRSPHCAGSALAARPCQALVTAARRHDDALGIMAVSALWRSDDRDRTTDGVPDLRARHCGGDLF